VVAGQAGSAKTVFGASSWRGRRAGQGGVFVTLDEPAVDLRANLATLGFDIAAGRRRPVALRRRLPRAALLGQLEPYNLETLAAQIGHAVDATGAERLVLDSLNAVLSLHPDAGVARQLLRSLISRCAAWA
jgi:circadian clock protein KaiC